ncbi:MAG: tRNA (adenosine(37)-N6)-threonylcarbamoyltransferase complex transferase subunit TsaD [Oscillospiraceae bacterium]|jgi:N6-L-threonylcarbamoyladenine synthase|nr:tRNA (adenosine(37)-N6)-threonylcarbamoyltransferase complex transferase subunit TsaD [Oscillospiraceae bacterium]
MLILSIESSCDETAVALVRDGREVLTDAISSQVELHREYGGVVPEIASRKHIEHIYALADQALRDAKCSRADLDAIAVTYAPGLIGALLVGVNFAKAAALAMDIPLIPVHHIRGHIAANYIAYPDLQPPFLALVVSGGHTLLVDVRDYTHMAILGGTRDDAAGECFDKVARVLHMPYPGGAALDRVAQGGDASQYALPRPKLSGNPLDMSFSGLKTAAINLLHNMEQKGESVNIPNFCASFSEAVGDMLIPRTMHALEQSGYRTLSVAGGVAANSRIRALLQANCAQLGVRLCIPPLSLCGDNAAMIGAQGYYEYLAGSIADQSLNAFATKSMEGESV